MNLFRNSLISEFANLNRLEEGELLAEILDEYCFIKEDDSLDRGNIVLAMLCLIKIHMKEMRELFPSENEAYLKGRGPTETFKH